MNPNTLKRTVLPDGKVVPTICLPYQMWEFHYETMVFPNESDFMDIQGLSYTTEEEALQGHEETAKKFTTIDTPKTP